jgi:RNA-directed DNA polymerase
VILVRYAHDIVAGFEHRSDAERFLAEMRELVEKFALSLHPCKARLIEFGCHAAIDRASRDLGKPKTFNLLASPTSAAAPVEVPSSCNAGRSETGRGPRLGEVKATLKRRMHEPIPKQGQWLGQVVRGHYAYHAVPTNFPRLRTFRYHVVDL